MKKEVIEIIDDTKHVRQNFPNLKDTIPEWILAIEQELNVAKEYWHKREEYNAWESMALIATLATTFLERTTKEDK